MARKLNFNKDIATKAAEKFPDYEIDFGAVEGEKVLTFRNLIRLSKEERREYTDAALSVQETLGEQLELARKAEEDGDEEAGKQALELLKQHDGTELTAGILREQLRILSGEADAEAILAEVDFASLVTIHQIVIEGIGAAEGE